VLGHRCIVYRARADAPILPNAAVVGVNLCAVLCLPGLSVVARFTCTLKVCHGIEQGRVAFVILDVVRDRRRISAVLPAQFSDLHFAQWVAEENGWLGVLAPSRRVIQFSPRRGAVTKSVIFPNLRITFRLVIPAMLRACDGQPSASGPIARHWWRYGHVILPRISFAAKGAHRVIAGAQQPDKSRGIRSPHWEHSGLR